MSIFSKKRKVILEDFCGEYYEKYFINPVIGSINVGESMAEVSIKAIAEVDNNFSNVDIKKFNQETTILRFELFSLAWTHQFEDKSSIDLSIFTDKFLIKINRPDIWEKLEEYNQAVARSETVGKTKEKLSEKDCAKYLFFGQYTKEGLKADCVARAINRWFTKDAWDKDITPNFLMFILCDRLGFEKNFELNKEAKFRLLAIIHGFYNGIKQSLQEIKLIGDYSIKS